MKSKFSSIFEELKFLKDLRADIEKKLNGYPEGVTERYKIIHQAEELDERINKLEIKRSW